MSVQRLTVAGERSAADNVLHTALLSPTTVRRCTDIIRVKEVPKHARQKEELRHLTFTHHLEYDLAGCQVMLLPKNLPRRWLWSRKYPICLHLQHSGSPDTSPSPVSIASTPASTPHGSPTHFASPGPPPTPPSELGGRQGSSESGEGNNWSTENNCWSREDDPMSTSLDMASFEEVTRDMCQEKTVTLFARSDGRR
ncbi:hypothetical protein GWK47_049069 [Chionoecetes opilio]|uniref:Uncharacterized protein n=1 Tax=Chionoecetes opilio TaxID=41210 RepID=A0A8J4Y9M1_CHIOP|nr:hypothetical protein GWK47_049069 [Chionoecetes opilio]